MFIDRIVLKLTAGKGGNGVVAWRREKYIPKGGPAGGNGGPGGSVILEADEQIPSLENYRQRRLIKAPNGGDGGGNCRQGKKGADLILKVPCGTLIKMEGTSELLCDLAVPGQQWLACRGGVGGKGNDFFKTSVNRAPHHATLGKEGESLILELELKLIADIGLVGFPNAGKSTLTSALAKVAVKIAPYPFTTLTPNLGYIEFEDYTRALIADIPGIIKNAHLNRGLGLEFLRHIERTRLLVYVLDAAGTEGRTPWEDFLVLKEELKSYSLELYQRPYCVVLNKCDLPESKPLIEEFKQLYEGAQGTCFLISAHDKVGLESLKKCFHSYFSLSAS